MLTRRCRSVIVLAAAIAAGCGSHGLEGTIPIRGRVTFQGQPLGRGEVRYVPLDAQGRVARGKIDSSSNFKLTTLTTGDGALPGEYRVVVIVPVDSSNEAAAARARDGKTAVEPTEPSPSIPACYAPETSGLTDTVDASHSGYKEFDLVP